MPKAYLFIDGANFFNIVKSLDLMVDYLKMIEYLEHATDSYIVRPYFYVAMGEEGKEDHTSSLLEWMQYSGFRVVTKPLSKYYNPTTKTTTTKGNLDLEMAVDMIRLAPHYDIAMMVTSDGDFAPVAKYLQDLGKVVVGVASSEKGSMIISHVLRKSLDMFVDLSEVRDELHRQNI